MAQLNDLLVLGKANIKNGIQSKGDHDFLAHSNEFTFAPAGYSGDIYINYRTASGGYDGSIDTYRFLNGNKTLANVAATTFYGALSGNATSATTAGTLTSITEGDKASSTDTKRRVWFSYNDNVTGRPAYDDRLTFKTSTGTLYAPTFSGSLNGNATSASYLVSRGNVTAESGANRPAVSGLSMSQAYNNSYPTTYGNVITLNGGGCGQLLIGWSGISGAVAPAYIRSKRDTSDANWSAWERLVVEDTNLWNIRIKSNSLPGQWVQGCNGNAMVNSTVDPGGFSPMLSGGTTNGRMVLAYYTNGLQCTYITKANCDSNNNSPSATAMLMNESGGAHWPGLLNQGSTDADPSIASMNRFQADLYVAGNGSAPNSPKVAGFYLGKSQTDDNRHMDIVSGGDFSYIDFNKHSKANDYTTRLIANVTTGLTEFTWDNSAESKRLKINGVLEMTNPIIFSNASGGNKSSNYISAGGGYSTGSGRLGLKLVACDQPDVQTGIGMDLTGFSYETCLSTSRAGNTTTSYITFATHNTESTTYHRLGYFQASGAANPTATFVVHGIIECNKMRTQNCGTVTQMNAITNAAKGEIFFVYV